MRDRTGSASTTADGLNVSPALIERLETYLRTWDECVAAWRVLDMGGLRIPNDHSDAQYDARVLEQLRDLSRRIAALTADVLG